VLNIKTSKRKNNVYACGSAQSEYVKDLRQNWRLYIIAIPAVAFYIIFHYLPMYGVIIAFKDLNIRAGVSFFNAVFESPWVGLKHFRDFFDSYYFVKILRNTLVISLSNLIFSFPAPILLAILINEIKNNFFASVVKTISYIPHFISLVVICGMVRSFVDRNGLITQMLAFLGMEPKNLLNDPNLFVPIYVISHIWQTIGWDSIIYIAALAGINQELYEAAKIDGANRFRQTIHVTIPGILPTIVILLILRIGSVLNVGYEKIILLYNPITYEKADVISSFVFRKGIIDSSWSYSSAVEIFNSACNFALLISANSAARKLSDTSLW
jgi:putative aldouronate transport system permease protein